MDFGLSSIPQWIAEQFMTRGHFEHQLATFRNGLWTKRNEMIRGLQQYMGDSVTFTEPQGGLNLWCKINREVDDFKLLDESSNEACFSFREAFMALIRGLFAFVMPDLNWMRSMMDLPISMTLCSFIASKKRTISS
ncbi:hypothetical protein [Paenibacillus alba]|uniref:Uncharacterized protein n=1 Tax=Paenibacillus alba TaxID=1197127 RepID=A0ABU6GEC3_9BACL|nr:hypothetical protein [Paenibacillus alba]MEC0232000.1 hypothetical protein [Paenibacillus alba]